ncbi:MAG: hypothetical protein A3K30_02365 [Deltaproteobacteria bacterium RBG_13_51_10]|nr:MAG: hypothetical protein A3K30_02365 [Deltaproteobacteria bacterium RBG_13_51_10]
MQAERVGALFWLAVGLISIYGSTRLGLGVLREPGSGFLSFLAGCFISLVAIIIFLQTFFREQGAQSKLKALWAEVNWRRPATVSLLTLGFILVLERAGFLLAGFFLLLTLFKWMEKFSWKKALIIPAITLGSAYLLFNVFLKATLPKGFFGF